MPELGSVCATRQGMATTNNDLFLRLWFEVLPEKIGYHCTSQDDALASGMKWFPFNKGGGFRKWYGNNEYIVNFENNGQTICDYIDNTPGARVKSNGRVINRQYYFLPCITWSDICGIRRRDTPQSEAVWHQLPAHGSQAGRRLRCN